MWNFTQKYYPDQKEILIKIKRHTFLLACIVGVPATRDKIRSKGEGEGRDWLTDRYLTLRTKPPALLVYINNCSPLGGFLQHPQEQEVAAIKQVNVESVLWLVLRSIYNQKGETKAVCNAVIVTSREIKPSCFLELKQ